MLTVSTSRLHRWIAFAIVLIITTSIVLSFPAAQAQPGGALTVDSSGHWFVYNDTGEPYFMAGAGGPEGFLYYSDERKQQIVDNLITSGANAIYMHSIRSNGGDGKASENPFNDTSNPNSGVNMDVLDNWDRYFKQLDDAGITLWLHLYDDGTRPWGCAVPLPQAEKDYVSTIVNKFKKYQHVVWLSGEEHKMKGCDDAQDVVKMKALAAEIRKHDTVHPLGVHHNNGEKFAYAGDPNINVFGQQVCGSDSHRSVDGLHNVGAWGDYVYVMAECHPWHKDLLRDGDRTTLRQSFWGSVMAGGYVLFYDAYEQTDPSLAMLEDLGRINSFMNTTRFHEMAPNDGLANGGTRWVLANESKGLYILYSNKNPSDMGAKNLTAGTYALTWYNPIDGKTVRQTKTVNSGNQNFTKPSGIGNEAVLYVERQNGSAPTATPPTTTPPTATPVPPTATPAPGGPEVTGFNGIPANGVVSGVAEIEATVEGSDIARVTFDLTGQQNDTHTEKVVPYYFKGDINGDPKGWDTTSVPDGEYILTATAFNSAGASGSKSIEFTIQNTEPTATPVPATATPTPSGPQVTEFKGVSADGSVSGVAEMEAIVTGSDIVKVTFALTGPQNDTWTERETPYYFKGNNGDKLLGWNTQKVPNGEYTLTATAFDSAGESSAKSVTFTVQN